MRRIVAGALIGLSSVFLLISVIGIAAIWIGNRPLTRTTTSFLQEVDSRLVLVQTDIQNARMEVERALRILDSAEKALTPLIGGTSGATDLLAKVNGIFKNSLIPGLQNAQSSISQVTTTLENLRESLRQINSLPYVGLNIPGDELLAGILSTVNGLNAEIADVQDLAQRTSTFMSDTSYLLGGDFTTTRQHLQDLSETLNDYDNQVTNWRSQAARLIKSLPGWILIASIVLTFLLLWFGFSQYALLLNSFRLWKGENSFTWKKNKKTRTLK